MKKELYRELEIPQGVEVSVKGNRIIVKGPEGENSKELDLGMLELRVSEGKIIIGCKVATKKEKRSMNTFYAHIKNLVRGVQKKFEYTLKVASSHFPITVKIEGNLATIKNYYGEKIDRKTKIPKGAEIKVDKDIITVTSVDREIAGQAAANFENATKVNNRDRRIFQDGVYITKKDGKEI